MEGTNVGLAGGLTDPYGSSQASLINERILHEGDRPMQAPTRHNPAVGNVSAGGTSADNTAPDTQCPACTRRKGSVHDKSPASRHVSKIRGKHTQNVRD